MIHLGDICNIDGTKIPFVDVVAGGSPCQDLSIAGKRAGLAGARSGLFMEQIRVIKEMREASGAAYPRFMVWENVPGAFSSNKGQDFAAVLEETIRIAEAEPEAPCIEVPEKGWPTWGCYRDMDGRWSVAWRTLDAQYWGVPQRRRRIALVADFGGNTAPEILFERKSVSGDPETRPSARQGTAAAAQGSADETSVSVKCQKENVKSIDCRNHRISDISGTLQSKPNGGYSLNYINPICFYPERENCLTPWDVQSRRIFDKDGVWPSLYGGEGGGHGYVAGFSAGQGEKAGGIGYQEEIAPSLKSVETLLFENHSQDSRYKGSLEVCQMLPAQSGTGGNNTPFAVQSCADILCRAYGQSNAETLRDLCPTLNCNHEQPIVAANMPIAHPLDFVRRLTPLECERLQGYPDGWTDIGEWYDGNGKNHKPADSPRYKALGNSIALPPWRFVLSRIYAYLPEGAALGSLFDGIGGFPLIWRELGGVPVWASEIEEFCIAVTEKRFGHDPD